MEIMIAAKYLVYLSYQGKQQSLTPLKLQKLLYLAQGWSYVWDKKPIFPNVKFEAWQYGPVNYEVYLYFKEFGRQEIPITEGYDCRNSESLDECSTLETIWNNYGSYSAFQLVDLTHSQTPWIEAYNNNISITSEAIKNYFLSIY